MTGIIVSKLETIYFEIRNIEDSQQKKAVVKTTTKFREEMHEKCCALQNMRLS
jgi:hypothetical protein